MDAKVFVPPPRLSVDSFDGPLGRSIIDTHIWAVDQGLRGAGAYALFDGYCQLLVIHGVPLWRAQAGMQTLHPHWGAYSYLWRRDLNAIQPEQHARRDMGNPQWLRSPMYDLIRRANAGENNPSMRRHLDAGPDQRDFAALMNSSAKARPTISPSFSASARAATLRRAPVPSIRSRRIAPAASTTTTWRSCNRPCRRYRWR
jgi:hypothetical protein